MGWELSGSDRGQFDVSPWASPLIEVSYPGTHVGRSFDPMGQSRSLLPIHACSSTYHSIRRGSCRELPT